MSASKLVTDFKFNVLSTTRGHPRTNTIKSQYTSKTFFMYPIYILIKNMYPSPTDLQTLSKHKKHTTLEMPQARQGTLLNEATGKPKTLQPKPTNGSWPITRRKTKQGLSPSAAKYPAPLPETLAVQKCWTHEHSIKFWTNTVALNTAIQCFDMTFQLMDHQIKCGCKRISSSEDTVKTTIFWLLWPWPWWQQNNLFVRCDNDASPHYVWLQKVKPFRRYHLENIQWSCEPLLWP